MKFRLLWVDDQATFAKSGKTEEWPTMLLNFLREDALPDTNCYFGPVTDGGRTVPASYMDIWFASSFPRALDLIHKHEFDAAILDMRMPVGGSDHEATKKYLKLKGRRLPDPLSINEEMAFGFWLWREVKTASPNALVLFYSNYANIGREAFVYHPFMNPDPHTQLSPAIHEKNASSLGDTFVRYLDNRARAALKYNDPGLLSELVRALTQNSICADDEALLMEEKLLLSDYHATKVSLSDLFPSFAFAVANGFATEDEERRRVLQILGQALGRHEQCAVLARLAAPRSLDWTDRPTYGLQLVRDLSWGKQIQAWPIDVGYSPLEMLSHGKSPNKEMTPEDQAGWECAKDLASKQVEAIGSFSRDSEAVRSLREWSAVCHKLSQPFTDDAVPDDIKRFKSAFRWIPKAILADLTKSVSKNWMEVVSCNHQISGYKPSIQKGVQCFFDDLSDNSEMTCGIVGSGGSRRPRQCWMFIAGKPRNTRLWPHVEAESNKIPSGLSLLRGYLICYQFKSTGGDFEWRCFEESRRGEHVDWDERHEIEKHIAEAFPQSSMAIGYAFVLPDYPPKAD